MTRRVTCPSCAPVWRKLVGRYPGEDVKLVEGILHVDCRCDECNKPLTVGQRAFCVSLSTPRTPYFRWEHEFVGEVLDAD